MDSFLNYRAQEVAPGGLVFITVPARPDGTPHSKVIYNMLADILGSCFLDLAKKVYIYVILCNLIRLILCEGI